MLNELITAVRERQLEVVKSLIKSNAYNFLLFHPVAPYCPEFHRIGDMNGDMS